MNVFFGIVWDCIGLTSFNGPDKLIDQCWPDPMIIPKLAGSAWLAGWQPNQKSVDEEH